MKKDFWNSYGILKKAYKSKELSPDLQGTIELQRGTAERFNEEFAQSRGKSITVKVAGWFKQGEEEKFIQLVITPSYRPKQSPSYGGPNSLEGFFEDGPEDE